MATDGVTPAELPGTVSRLPTEREVARLQRSRLLHPSFLIPGTIVAAIMIAGVFGQLVAPHDPEIGVLADHFLPPMGFEGSSPKYLLGTDALGRDILSRLILGARISMIVALAAIFVGGGIGTILGLVSGYLGGWVDAVIMRLVDAAFAFPTIFLALLLAATLGPGVGNLVLVIALVLWSRFARLVRGEVLVAKTKDYVALARIAGASDLHIMVRHIFPTALNTIVVVSTLQVGVVIILESSLSFLGVGVPPPAPAWGSMLSAGREDLSTAWWVSALPGCAIMITVLSLNLLGDWLRDALDPRMRQA